MEIKDILERIALPARSSKKGWKDTSKLDEIAALLEEVGSPYKLIKQSKYAYIFGQKDIEFGKQTLLISSHADIVDNIKEPFSELKEEERYFKGTYDNLGTNAAAVYAMINYDLPKNTFFAFTADEETGRCLGAEYALSYLINRSGKNPYVIALDVTDEGYENNRLFTIEGLHGQSEGYRRGLAKTIMLTEGENQSCEFVRLDKNDNNSFLPESYRAKNLTVYDESVFYASQGLNSFSMCLPGDGEMHNDKGFYIKEPVMKGYADSLVSIICKLTQSREETIEKIKAAKDAYVSEAKKISFYKIEKFSYAVSSYWEDDYIKPVKSTSWELEDDEIDGQMSIYDFIDSSEQYPREHLNVSKLDAKTYQKLYDMFSTQLSEYDYGPDDFDEFYDTLIEEYLLEDDKQLKDLLEEIYHDYFLKISGTYFGDSDSEPVSGWYDEIDEDYDCGYDERY